MTLQQHHQNSNFYKYNVTNKDNKAGIEMIKAHFFTAATIPTAAEIWCTYGQIQGPTSMHIKYMSLTVISRKICYDTKTNSLVHLYQSIGI